MDLIIASNNRHKADEIKTILKDVFDAIYTLSEKHIEIEPEENGQTFLENARIKAEAVQKLAGNCAVIADDSGLCVDALAGAPGILSARYAGEPCNDAANNEKLLTAMNAINERGAHFVSCVALLFPDGKMVWGEGKIDGTILREQKGSGGFGYDPLFYIPNCAKTFAQMNAEEKNKISHRKAALQNLLSKLTNQ